MSSLLHVPFPKAHLVAAIAGAALFAMVPTTQARVTRIVIDATAPITGQPYQQPTGRAFGELDPADPHNAILTDINLAPENASGKVEYIASFRLRIPNDLTSGVMWHDVPNRGGNVGFPADSFAANDMPLLSGWQGDICRSTRIGFHVQLPIVSDVGSEMHADGIRRDVLLVEAGSSWNPTLAGMSHTSLLSVTLSYARKHTR